MRVALDIETDGLLASKIHCICVVDLDSEKTWDFWGSSLKQFPQFAKKIRKVVVHNGIEFDLPVLRSLQGVKFPEDFVEDTLVISRLLEYTLEGGHSLEAWGGRLKCKKTGLDITDWSKLTPDMLLRCRGDAQLTKLLYFHLLTKAKIDYKDAFKWAWKIEHKIAHICRRMKEDGFKYDKSTADSLRQEVQLQVDAIDKKLEEAFPPKVEEIQLKTKIKRVVTPFNPASPKQIVERLSQYWSPVEFTEVGNAKVTEANLATLSDNAPEAAKLLVKRLMLSSRVRKFDEWTKAYDECTGRIHPTFVGIGTWTGRMAHRDPNLGNVAAPKSIKYKGEELKSMATALGGRMRRLWQATPGNWLVGCDADSIQLRIFAHYINDPQFTLSLLKGDKENGTDPHSLNAVILGCDRDTAKTFIYAFLLGAGDRKIGDILGGTTSRGREAKSSFIKAYPGLAQLKERDIPRDAKRGYFVGFDGRLVKCDSEHHMLAGYLQNGEACIMKHANVKWQETLKDEPFRWWQVNFVHDEFQTEVAGTEAQALHVGQVQADCIKLVGEEFALNCPMAGTFRIGRDWYDTH